MRSPNDVLADLRLKMPEYLANGSRLGWLIVPITQQVEIYRINQWKLYKVLQSLPVKMFYLDLSQIFNAD